MKNRAISRLCVARRAGLLVAAVAAVCPKIAAAAAADQFVYLFGPAVSTGSGAPSLGGVTYNPNTNTYYTLGFSGTGQSIRSVTNNSSATFTGTTLVGQTDWLNLLKTDNIVTGDIPANVTATNPTVGGMLLNPATLTVGNITYAPGTLGIVIEAAKTSISGVINPSLSKLVYAYDLRAVTYDGSGNYNASSAGGRDYNGDGTIEGNDVFYPIVSFADQQSINPGQTSTSNNVARRFAFSSNGQSIYFDDSSAAYGGIYKVNLTATGSSAISKIVTSKNGTTINTEPWVVPTSTRDLGGGFGTGDQVLFAGSTDNGNIGGVNYVVDNGTTVSTTKTLLTAKQISGFLDYSGASATVGSITADSSGGIYLENSNSTYGGIFQYDSSGRLAKVFSSAEQRTFDFANAVTYSSSVLETQIIPATVSYTAGPTVINQLIYREVSLKAPVGVNVYMPGDFNHDGVINATDIANFTAHLGLRGAVSGYISTASGSTPVNGDYFTYDLNGAFATTVGATSVEAVSVDWKDAQIFCQYAGLSYGDVNMDGSVNQTDFNIIAANYNTDSKTWIQGNIDSVRIAAPDKDKVNFADLVTLAANYPAGSKPVITGYGSAVQTDADRAFAVTANGTISQLINPNSAGGTINWSNAASWSNGVPNSSGGVASLLTKPLNDTTLNIDGTYTVGQLNFDSYFNYTLSGVGTLHFSGNNGTVAEINAFAASPVISAALSLDSPTNVTITYSTDTATLSNSIVGTGSLTKLGGGTVLLSGSNTYGGGTNVSAGSLQVSRPASLPGYATANVVSVGTGASLIVNAGGSSEWTQPSIDSLRSNGNFSSGSILGIDTTNAAGVFELSSNIGGALGFLKQGPNTLLLTGSNSYAGGTNVSSGTLEAKTPAALSQYATIGSVLVNPGATLAVNVGGTSEWTGANIDTLRTSANFSTGSALGIDTTDATGFFIYGSAITGTGGLTKLGPNTLVLLGSNTYNGSTSVLQGTLQLSFGLATIATNIISASSVLALQGNGGLTVLGKASATNSQTFASATLNTGSGALIATASSSNPLLVALGSITRNTGATLDFNLPSGTQNASNGVTTSSSTSNGIIGGWATVSQADWATKSTNNITALAAGSYTNDTWSSANNTTVTTSNFLSLNSSTNSLRFNLPSAYTLTLSGVNNIASGGILVAPTVGPFTNSISGGTLTGKTGVDLIVNQFNTGGNFEIDSIIADSTSATGLTKAGGGLLTLTANNTYTGATYVNSGSLNVSSGSLASTAINVLPGGTLNTTPLTALPAAAIVTTTGTVNFGANTGTSGPAPITVGGLSIGTGGLVTIGNAANHSNHTVVVTSNLVLAGGTDLWTGKLDLAGNDVVVHNGSLNTLTNQIKSGFNASGGGNWKGAEGITSSTAAGDTAHLTAVGVIQNSVDGTSTGAALYSSASGSLGLFDGQSLVNSDVLMKYTFYGDTNLDGKVDGSDYSRIDSGYISQATGWYNGDFNYDGVINGSDYTLIDNAFNTQGGSLAASIADPTAIATAQVAGADITPAVPEPGTLGAMAFGALGLLSRRKRIR